MSDPAGERDLRNYLHRKSALSMGYKKVYLEAPPPELDQAIKARARRALQWLGPAIVAGVITFILVGGLILGVGKWMHAMVAAENNIKAIRKQQAEELLEQERAAPITVVIDASHLAAPATSETSKDKTASGKKK